MNEMGRPDLEEFLSALSGFVDKKSASPDSSYLKFLDIFCRSVGSTEGHLVRPGDGGRLESVSSFGVEPSFDDDFNKSRDGGVSPLDDAFSGQRVVAIVEIKPSGVPPWFYSLMQRHGYKALVAVPILSSAGTTGLLCAYYRDVCLFDQGTLERLLSLGRMLGGAETSGAKPPAEGAAAAPAPAAARGETDLDEFIESLTRRPFTKIQVFGGLVEAARRAFPGSAVVCGPLRVVSGDMLITIADGADVPSSAVSHRYALPRLLRQALVTGDAPPSLSASEQGEFKALMKMTRAQILCRPLLWQGKTQAAVILWREGRAYDRGDGLRLGRLAAVAALALNAA